MQNIDDTGIRNYNRDRNKRGRELFVKKKGNISIKAKLLGIIIPVVIAIILILVFTAYHVSSGIIESYSKNLLESSVNSQASKIEAWLEENLASMQMAKNMIEKLHPDEAQLQTILDASCGYSENYPDGLFLADANGSFLKGTDSKKQEPNPKESMWYQEGGKTVTLMIAASVWANPDESRFIGDFKTTDVALEAKADVLNNLPMILDDTSKTSSRIRDNFEGVVYDLCSGKGKSRSNKDLGINRENRWKNCILTNGERPLNSYVSQGGAMNRILEVECGENVYADPGRSADIVKKNYGFAGKDFIELIETMGIDTIRGIQEYILQELQDDEKMQKQSLSLSIVLTADKLVTDYLFKDGQKISLNDAKETLIDRNELSDNERCYRYLVDKVAMNPQRFDLDSNVEKWGSIDKEYAVFINQAFDELCRAGGFAKKSFLSWADRKGLLLTQAGKTSRTKRIDGNVKRCIFLKIEEDEPKEGFIPMDKMDHLPFK